MTTATLVIEVLADHVLCALSGSGWGYSAQVFPGETAHDLTHAQLLALGTGVHKVEVDLKIRSTELARLSRGKDQDAIDGLRFMLFQERTGFITSNELLCSTVFAFNPRTAEQILAFLPEHHTEQIREYVSCIPRTSLMRRFRPTYWLFQGAGKRLVPEENLVALRQHFS